MSPIDYSIDSLAESSSARYFLKLALEQAYKKHGRINLADFSRRAGFSSRSFVLEYLSGNKGLSRDSLKRIRTALNLPREASNLFSLLAISEQPNIAEKSLKDRDIANEIFNSRKTLRAKEELELRRRKNPTLTNNAVLYQVFAALGSIQKGADLNQILQRTRLTRLVINQALISLLSAQLIEKKEKRYHVVESKIDSFGLRGESGFLDLVKSVSIAIGNDCDRLISDSTNLLFYSAFSTDASRVAALRARLKDAIIDVLDEFQADEGEQVKQIFICLRGY